MMDWLGCLRKMLWRKPISAGKKPPGILGFQRLFGLPEKFLFFRKMSGAKLLATSIHQRDPVSSPQGVQIVSTIDQQETLQE